MNTSLQSTAQVLAIFACIWVASLAHAQSIDITEPSEQNKLQNSSGKIDNPVPEEIIEDFDPSDYDEITIVIPLEEQCREFADILRGSAYRRAMYLSSFSAEERFVLKSIDESVATMDPKFPDLMRKALREVYSSEIKDRNNDAAFLFAVQHRDKAELICRDELERPWWKFW